MTDTKTTSKEISKTVAKPAETSASAAKENESAAKDNLYLSFLQKAFPSFGIPADALKKVAASNNEELAKSLLIAALSGMTWGMLWKLETKDTDIDLEKLGDQVNAVLRDRFRENDSLADEIKEAMKANAQVSAGWQAAFDEMKKLYDGSISEMREQVKNVRAEMDELRKKAAVPSVAPAPVTPQVQISTEMPAEKPRLFFGRRSLEAPAYDAIEYQQNYLILMRKFLENDDYSAEQRKFLLECWNAGDSVAKIETFARPKFDVPFMRDVRAALEKRNSRK